MSSKDKKKNEVEWFENPGIVTNLIILMIGLIVILSQSFAVNNGLGVYEILSGILNHNIGYLLVFSYFIALKTKVGKRYFDFFNIFLIIFYGLTTITSLLTLLQSFDLGSVLGFGIDLMILIYMIHTFLRSTAMWKSMGLNKSPFNEISNSGYFYSILVLSVTLLAVNLVFTTSLDGTILTLMDSIYTILFIRYVFLYGEYLDKKKISINNIGNFDQITDKVKESVNGFVEDVKDKIEDAKLDEKFDAAKKKVVEVADNMKEKAIDIKEDLEDKIEDAKLDEKFEKAKGKVSGFVDDLASDVKSFVKDAKIEEKIETAKKKVDDFVEENKLDEKFETAKKKVVEMAQDATENVKTFVKENKVDEKIETAKNKVVEVAQDVTEDVKTFVKDAKVEEKVEKAKSEVSRFVNEVKDDVNSLVGKDKKENTKEKKHFFSRKKKSSKEKSSKSDTKKGSK